ncbi:hypothetical protein J1N35_026819 [Gossypium stocksii]|uniref:DUF4283 domain-containing protein n=1 Tax=Gossypium stocksii TaxID=47602 RepID=A0A9D3ZYZ9_9ROSI|nr:hypothetical protein J1N35_026819 [Gossypium stocksii]
MESDFAGLTLNEEEEVILQIQAIPDLEREEGVFRLVGCFLTASIIHFQAMKSTMANLWHPIQGVQIRDLGEMRSWNTTIIMNTFGTDVAIKILQIPLTRIAHEDFQVWRVNLKLKKVVADIRCPRCHQNEENSLHIFRPTTAEMYGDGLPGSSDRGQLNIFDFFVVVSGLFGSIEI